MQPFTPEVLADLFGSLLDADKAAFLRLIVMRYASTPQILAAELYRGLSADGAAAFFRLIGKESTAADAWQLVRELPSEQSSHFTQALFDRFLCSLKNARRLAREEQIPDEQSNRELDEAVERAYEKRISELRAPLVTELQQVQSKLKGRRKADPGLLKRGEYIDGLKKQGKAEDARLRDILKNHPGWVTEYEGKLLTKQQKHKVFERLRGWHRRYLEHVAKNSASATEFRS